MLCPLLGIPACYHSIMVDRCWNQKQEAEKNEPSGAAAPNVKNSNDKGYWESSQGYADQAHDHSKSAATYACYGNILGILFWVYMLFFAEGKDREWLKDWNIDEWWSDGP